MSGRKKSAVSASQPNIDIQKENVDNLVKLLAPNAPIKASVDECPEGDLIIRSKAFARRVTNVATELMAKNEQLMKFAYFCSPRKNTEDPQDMKFYRIFFLANNLIKQTHNRAYVAYDMEIATELKDKKKLKKYPNALKDRKPLSGGTERPAFFHELLAVIQFVGMHFVKHIPILRVMAKLIEIEVNKASPDKERLRRILCDTAYCLNSLVLEIAIMHVSLPKITQDAVENFMKKCRSHFQGEPFEGTEADQNFKKALAHGMWSIFNGAEGSLTDLKHTLNVLKDTRDELTHIDDGTVNSYGEFVALYILNPQTFSALPYWVSDHEKLCVINGSRINLRFRLWNEVLDAWKFIMLDCDPQQKALLSAVYLYYMKAVVMPRYATFAANIYHKKDPHILPEFILPSELEMTNNTWPESTNFCTLYKINPDFVYFMEGMFRGMPGLPRMRREQIEAPIPFANESPLAAIEFMRNTKQFTGDLENFNDIMLPAVTQYANDIKIAYLDLSTNKKLPPLQRKIRATYAAQYKPYATLLKNKYKKQFEQLQGNIESSIKSVIDEVHSLPDSLLHNAHDIFEFCIILDEKIKSAVEDFISWLVETVEIAAAEVEEAKRLAAASQKQQTEVLFASTASLSPPATTEERKPAPKGSGDGPLLVFSAASKMTDESQTTEETVATVEKINDVKLKRKGNVEDAKPVSTKERIIKLVNDSWKKTWELPTRNEQRPNGKVYSVDELQNTICNNLDFINFIDDVLKYGDKFIITTEEFNKLYKGIFGDEALRNAKKGAPGHYIYNLPNGFTAIGHTQAEGGRHQADRKGNIRIIGGKLKDALVGLGLTAEHLIQQGQKSDLSLG